MVNRIEIRSGYRILIQNDAGKSIVYDFRNKLQTARFWELQDEKLFRKGKLIGGKVIRWNDMTEITIDEIMEDEKHESENEENAE